jgi:type IV secretory pathway VirJ component
MAVLAALVVALAWGPGVAIAWERVEAGRLGPVAIVRAEGEPKGSIIVFSDPRGNFTDLEQAVRAVAEAGYGVAVVDSAHYLTAIDRGSEDCHRIQDDLSALIRLIAQQGSATAGGPPILVGSGAGGAIAYAALAQAGPGDFAGAIGFEFSPDVPGRVPPTDTATRPSSKRKAGGAWQRRRRMTRRCGRTPKVIRLASSSFAATTTLAPPYSGSFPARPGPPHRDP